MSQIVSATFNDGVFKPDEKVSLSPNTRVRLFVETLEDEAKKRQQAWETLEKLWQESTFDSGGDRLSRDQLHERH